MSYLKVRRVKTGMQAVASPTENQPVGDGLSGAAAVYRVFGCAKVQKDVRIGRCPKRPGIRDGNLPLGKLNEKVRVVFVELFGSRCAHSRDAALTGHTANPLASDLCSQSVLFSGGPHTTVAAMVLSPALAVQPVGR